MLVATFLWGGSFVLIDFTLDNVSPLFIIAVRFLGAAVVVFFAGIRKLKMLDWRTVGYGALMGTVLFFAQAFATYGLERTTPGKNAFLTATYCIIVPFLCWILYNKKPDRYNISAAVVGLAGIGLISLDERLTMGLGDGLTLIGGFFFALHIIVTSKALESRSVVLLTMVQFAVTGIISAVLTLLYDPVPKSLPVNTIWMLVFLAVVSTALCILLQIYGQKYTPPSQAAIFLAFEAVFGTVFSILFRDEVLTLKLAAGFFLMFFAVIISETKLKGLRVNRIAKTKT